MAPSPQNVSATRGSRRRLNASAAPTTTGQRSPSIETSGETVDATLVDLVSRSSYPFPGNLWYALVEPDPVAPELAGVTAYRDGILLATTG